MACFQWFQALYIKSNKCKILRKLMVINNYGVFFIIKIMYCSLLMIYLIPLISSEKPRL